MLKIYGSWLCPDCIRCLEELDEKGIAYEYLDFAENLGNLKEFLRLRDSQDVFSVIRGSGRIGILCIVDGQGIIGLDWDKYLK